LLIGTLLWAQGGKMFTWTSCFLFSSEMI